MGCVWAAGPAIVALIVGAWVTLNGTVTDIKTDQKELAKQIGSNHAELVGTMNTTRVELVRSIDEVAKQIAVSNQKLDDMANGLRKLK